MADKDKNGFLDFVEIQELHKKFLSNYGIKKLYKFCKQQYKGRDLQKIGFTKSEGAELFNRFYKIRNGKLSSFNYLKVTFSNNQTKAFIAKYYFL